MTKILEWSDFQKENEVYLKNKGIENPSVEEAFKLGQIAFIGQIAETLGMSLTYNGLDWIDEIGKKLRDEREMEHFDSMSSTLKTFEGNFLEDPMCVEFSSWIRNSIKWRSEKMGYGNISQALNDAINECLRKHTNRDYLTCSNSLTSDLEDVLVYHGINVNDAIRLSWKWSD